MIKHYKFKSHHRRLLNEAKAGQTLSFKPPQGEEDRMYIYMRLCRLAQGKTELRGTQTTHSRGAENA